MAGKATEEINGAPVKPPKFILLTLAALFAFASTVSADEARSAITPRSEKVARANWTPVRQESGQANGASRVVRAQAVEDLPAPAGKPIPTPVPSRVFEQELPQGGYMEGPIVDQPVYGGTYFEGDIGHNLPCDSMICGGGNCGGCGGIGCDSGPYCDSLGCASGCNGRHGWLPCLTFCVPQDGWFSAEYLLWYQKGMYLPPLASSNATGIASSPRLDNQGSTVLFGGNSDYVEGSLDGLRLSFGFFLDHCHEWSIAADYFGWNQITDGALFLGSPNASLGRPIFNAANAGAPAAQFVNFVGNNAEGTAVNVNGNLSIGLSSELQSGGFQFRRFLVCKDGCGDTIFMNLPAGYRSRIDLGIGYRYTELDENLFIQENLTFPTAPANANELTMSDRFDTRTQFNGFDFGMYYTRHRGCWTLDMQGRFGIGVNNQQVNINGLTIGDQFPAPGIQSGLLAMGSNIGSYSRDRISVLPEFRANIGYLITPRLKATVGYTFMYWSNVVRPGDQIDLAVDRNAVPGSPIQSPGIFPQFEFGETDYWVQGVSFGGEYRW